MRACVCARVYARELMCVHVCVRVKQALFDDRNVSGVCVDVCDCMFASYVHVRARTCVCILQGLVDDPDMSSGKWSDCPYIQSFQFEGWGSISISWI